MIAVARLQISNMQTCLLLLKNVDMQNQNLRDYFRPLEELQSWTIYLSSLFSILLCTACQCKGKVFCGHYARKSVNTFSQSLSVPPLLTHHIHRALLDFCNLACFAVAAKVLYSQYDQVWLCDVVTNTTLILRVCCQIFTFVLQEKNNSNFKAKQFVV